MIREFATGQTTSAQLDQFLSECLARAATALEHFPTLEALRVERGVDALQEDLIATLGLCPQSALELGARVQAVLRLLQREVHHLRGEDANSFAGHNACLYWANPTFGFTGWLAANRRN